MEAAQGQQSTPGGTSGTKPTTVVEVVLDELDPSLVVVVVEDGTVEAVVVAVVAGSGGRGVASTPA